MSMTPDITDRLARAVRTALAAAGLPDTGDCGWEIPRQAEHGDYASNVAMALARVAKRPPRQIAQAIATHFPASPELDRVEIAGPGFLNVFLSPAWVAAAVRDILDAGVSYGRGHEARDRRVRLEFVSANPTGPLVIVNARAAAVGDALARLLRARGAAVTTEYYVDDAGNQFLALARSFEARIRQAVVEDARLPENGYPGEYLIDVAREYVDAHGLTSRAALEAQLTTLGTSADEWLVRLGRHAVARM